MKPSLGRIVLVPVEPVTNNGSDVAVGIITRVWSDTMVNLRVFLDTESASRSMPSVHLYPTAEDAAGDTRSCYWPPRVAS